MELDEIIRKYAVKNRLRYGKAYEKAVLGKVLANNPRLKERIRGVRGDIVRIVEEVNKLKSGELKKLEESEEKNRIDGECKIELPQEPKKRVRTRLAPNPNGAATLGSARGLVINHYLAKKYGGDFILRFDDTDPKSKRPLVEAYRWYLEDCKFLQTEPDEIYYASERIEKYYHYAEKLIKMGKAYVCFCSKIKFKRLKDAKKTCPHQDVTPQENLQYWKKMLEGGYKEEEAVLRIKTDMKHKDPALRDWVAFRILQVEHPRVGGKYRVWPMLDFESAMEDKLLGITHIARGKDLADSERRQKFIYDYFGWKYPEVMHWGRIKIREFGKLSTSGIRRGIIMGTYKGWDDPKLPTIRALRRRGVSSEAIRKFILKLGITNTDISLSLENLFSENRKIIDAQANRYFFVSAPVEMVITQVKEKTKKVKLPLHLGFPERGKKEIKVTSQEGKVKLFISQEDAKKLEVGKEVRLMHLFNVKIEKKSTKIRARYLEEKRLQVEKLQWVTESHIPAEILMPGEAVKGFCEENCKKLNVGEVVQLERFGFVRLEEKGDELRFCFTHK